MIFISLAVIFLKLYVSGERVVPLLLPERTFVKVVPSLDADIMKLYDLSLPLYQATSILQMAFSLPKSLSIDEPRPLLVHLVRTSLSITFAAPDDSSAVGLIIAIFFSKSI